MNRALGGLLLVGVSCIAFVFTGCNGGDDGGNNGGGGGGGTSPASFQGFVTYTETPPSNPTTAFVLPTSASSSATPTQVAARAFFPTLMINSITPGASGAAASENHAGFIYVGAPPGGGGDQQLYGVSLTPGTIPAPRLLASDNFDIQMCPGPIGSFGGSAASIDVNPAVVYRDLTNGSTAFVIFSTTGPDHACGNLDDVTQAVNFQGSGSQASTTLPGVPVAAVYRSSGQLGGLVIFTLDPSSPSGAFGTLSFLSDTTNFTSPTTLKTNVEFISVALQDASNTLLHGSQVFVVLFPLSGQPGLYRIDATGALSTSPLDSFTIPPGPTFSVASAADATTLYYFNAGQLRAVPLDGSANATTRGGYPDVTSIAGLTQNNVVVQTSSGVGLVAKNGTQTSSTITPIGTGATLKYVTPQVLFFNAPATLSGSTSIPTQAIASDENGVVLETLTNGQWVGARYAPTAGASGVQPQPTLLSALVAQAASQAAAPTPSDQGAIGFSGATFTEVGLDGTAHAFTGPGGSPITYSFSASNHPANSFSFQSVAPIDGASFAQPGSDNADIYQFDFIQHVIKQITHDPTIPKAVIE